MKAVNEITSILSAMGATPTIKIKSNNMIEIKVNAPTVARSENNEKAENAKV